MPASDTICISFGNWIVAFYVVYAMAAVALVAASAMLIDWSVNKIRANRVASQAKVSHRAQVLEPQA
jgi:hypothetical protein